MAVSRKQLREIEKTKYVEKISTLLSTDEQVLRVGSNIIAFPIVDSDGNEDFIKVTISIPTGAEKGTEPYDGFAESESYALKLKQQAEKKAKAEELKAKKIAKDKEYRKKKAEQLEKERKEKGE